MCKWILLRLSPVSLSLSLSLGQNFRVFSIGKTCQDNAEIVPEKYDFQTKSSFHLLHIAVAFGNSNNGRRPCFHFAYALYKIHSTLLLATSRHRLGRVEGVAGGNMGGREYPGHRPQHPDGEVQRTPICRF
eukprot:COSAG06_NODE_17866_length_917_cov_0.665037_2_plen_130_part_01